MPDDPDRPELDIDYEDEKAARATDPRLEAAMNAFWRHYHMKGPALWRCVQAAIEAADAHSAGEATDA